MWHAYQHLWWLFAAIGLASNCVTCLPALRQAHAKAAPASKQSMEAAIDASAGISRSAQEA